MAIKKSPASPTVDNTGANTVTAYNTETANYQLSVDASKKIHDISDLLFGIFFEDINFAADGGLYAEKIVNCSFEYTELAVDDALYHWMTLHANDDPYPCFMTYGLGFYDYFLLAEDIGAVGVPVLNCGLYCQARARQPVPIF